ncbi:MAG: IclR family transcriptional regulator [Spirochaetales bacterium]|nr:IclR family transcriptional regulator [Spirochaetales bacterium]
MAESAHRTTARILDILELVAEHPTGLTLADLSRRLDIPKSSLHPLATTLAVRKYLHYNPREERYYAGESLFVYGNKFINNVDILEKIRNVLLSVNQKINETLYFGVLSNLDVLYLIKMDLFSQFRVVSNIGNKLPAYSTGYGKALLSQYSPRQIEQFFPDGKLKSITANTLATVDELNAQLAEIRRTGFSYEKGESTEGIQCVATAIIVDGSYLAGMSIAVPEFRYTAEREIQFKSLLLEAKQQIQKIISEQRNQWIYSGEFV